MRLYSGRIRSWRFWMHAVLFLSGIVGVVIFLPRLPPSTVHLRAVDVDNVLEKHELELNNPRRPLPLKRTLYPPRKDMGPCPPLFGKVSVFVAFVSASMEGHYRVAQQSLECYLKGVNYTVMMVDLDKDPRVQEKCSKNMQLFFKKHCAASVYLPDTDWMLVLDADTGVVNPNHCVEEWIDDRVDVIFYERFFNWEIASGNYLVRNSEFGVNFLKAWGEWEFIQPGNWNGADNGVLQLHILKYVLPDASQEAENCNEIWHRAKDYDTYMAYVSCVKQALGATRLWPGKVRIYRRAHGWVRDGFITTDKWCDADFMLHGWKHQKVGQDGWESPFKQNLDPTKCGTGVSGWDWIPQKHVNASVIRKELAAFERSTGRTYPKPARDLMYITMPDVGICYPHCDKDT
ncbi:hypothetical protein ANCCAN_17513 [Ancylostoma caninum]|uniref:Uncharacterized protein n=1 Tax=Ancylostoma caninum TaxID=29170 RepID=A0A368G0Q2_ANCCA|nr:hypothetical protein ANCCAN_17513 [Ancylostoma caninum]